jgi:hypothetical protein
MKQLLTITLLLVVLSCGQNNSSKSDLLTSSIWTIEKESIDDFPRMSDKYEHKRCRQLGWLRGQRGTWFRI